MVIRICSILIFIFGIALNVYLQELEKIDSKQVELSKIKEEITSLEAELKTKTKKEKESFNAVENYSKQNFLLNKLINNLKTEEKSKQKEIDLTEKKISSLEEEISKLKENYSKYVVAVYKMGKAYEWAVLFDANSVRQALVRYKYLKRFSDRRKEDLIEFNKNKEELLSAAIQLEKEKKEKKTLVGQKQKEESALKIKLKERKKILNIVKHDKVELKKELEAKKKAEAQIKNLIAKLIENAERKRKDEEERLALEELKSETNSKTVSGSNIKIETEKNLNSNFDIDLSTSSLSSFSELKGRLIWPISNGKIIRRFGENRNEKLNTVTLNYGVDVIAGRDLNIKAVAEGVVSAIDWIPGYGSVIIITHKDDYRTVYSHLSEIYVQEGDKVKAGSLIAEVGESLEGNVLHFEIWNSRNNQNPEVWLARK